MRLLQIELGLVQYLVDGVTREGGWGNEPGEFKEANPLNTAEVLGGLLSVHHHLPRGPLRTHCDERIAGGMRYLLSTQLASGGWATGSAYIRKDIGSKGNIVSTVWAIWSLLEGARRCELGGQERGAIKTALECSQAYLRNRVGGLWAYSPELAEANPMASAYGLFGMALLLQAECDFGRWADQAALHLCVHEGLSRFEADYIAGGAVLTCEPAMNRMVVIQFFLALGQLLRCDGLATMEGKLRILSDRLWATVRSYGAEHLADCIVETQAVVEPGRARDFIHYAPVWGILAAMQHPDGVNFRHFRTLLDRVVKNIDPRCEGASYGGSKRHTWTTALTLMAIGSVVDNMDLAALVVPRRGDEAMASIDARKVFVVHGRNAAARRAMFDFLRSLHLEPIEWDEAVRLTGTGAPYVGDVLDKAFEHAQAVVVVMTGDDEARLRDQFRGKDEPPHENELTPQARPNVIFEAGMALGRNPARTIIVQIGPARPFSDILGRHVVHFTGSAEDRQTLASRLETAGCPVQRAGRDWLSSGDFAVAITALGTPSGGGTPGAQGAS